MKRLMSLLLSISILAMFTGCGNSVPNEEGEKIDSVSEKQSSSSNNEEQIKYKSINLFEKIKFAYNEEWSHMDQTYGAMLLEGNYAVFIVSPAAAGTLVSAETLEEIPALCESKVMDTAENLYQFFADNQTVREAGETSYVTVNDLDMMREEGTLINTMDDVTYPYTAFYFKTPNKLALPICVMGVMLESDDDIGAAMDEYINNVTIMQ